MHIDDEAGRHDGVIGGGETCSYIRRQNNRRLMKQAIYMQHKKKTIVVARARGDNSAIKASTNKVLYHNSVFISILDSNFNVTSRMDLGQG